jgi:hypothetical protein
VLGAAVASLPLVVELIAHGCRGLKVVEESVIVEDVGTTRGRKNEYSEFSEAIEKIG